MEVAGRSSVEESLHYCLFVQVGNNQCADLLQTAKEAELVTRSSEILNLFYSARDVTENPVTSWRSPELLNLKDDITDEVIGDIMAPLVGSLCTIDQKITTIEEEKQEEEASTSTGPSAKSASEGWSGTAAGGGTAAAATPGGATEDVSENESSSDGDFVKVKPGEETDPAAAGGGAAPEKKELDPRAVKAKMVAKWSVKSSVTGEGAMTS